MTGLNKIFIILMFGLLTVWVSGCIIDEIPTPTEEKTTAEKLQEACDELSIDLIIEGNITLPTNGKHDSSISWTSNNENVISTNGNVNVPYYNEKDVDVDLVATITISSSSIEKTFSVIVKKQEATIETVNYTPGYSFKMNEEDASVFPYYKGHLYAGLINKDGTPRLNFNEERGVKTRINVVKMFGAKANDPNFDNTQAFNNASNACGPTGEVYVPEGKYYFSTNAITGPFYAHVVLRNGASMVGDGPDKSILVSNYKNGEYVHSSYGKKTTTLYLENSSNSTVSNLGFSANTDDTCLPKDPTNTTANNPTGNAKAPAFAIMVYTTSILEITENVLIEDVYIEYFQYDGIRLYCTRDCKINRAYITKSTDVGGGGAGYGIEIRGEGHEAFNRIDSKLDSCYNIVTNCKIVGPYIRHGIIFSYLSHNNLIAFNEVSETADDAFDVHGQDEFLNLFTQNYAYRSRRGGFGFGNSGASAMHDESGYGNVCYKNVIENCYDGISVILGTKYTQLIDNIIIGTSRYPINISNGPNTKNENNTII